MSRKADVFVECNTCGRKSEEASTTIKQARRLAKQQGWVLSGDTDTCYDCRPGARKDRELAYFRDAVVHLLRDGFDLNYRQIGMITGLSRQRIHQICAEPIMYTDWIETTRKRFNAEITVPRLTEPEESTQADHHG